MPGQFTPQSDEELEPLVRVQLINLNGEVKAVQDFKLDGSSSEPSLGAIVAFANDTLNVDANYRLVLYLPGSEMPLGERPYSKLRSVLGDPVESFNAKHVLCYLLTVTVDFCSRGEQWATDGKRIAPDCSHLMRPSFIKLTKTLSS